VTADSAAGLAARSSGGVVEANSAILELLEVGSVLDVLEAEVVVMEVGSW